MLKNEDLKQINKTNVLLGMIYQYTIDADNNDLYEKTGITIKDINDCIKALSHIYTTEKIKHIKASEQANRWNKTNPEKHRQHNKDYIKKKKGGEII